MPKWGLTADQRKIGPWGLSEDLLSPAKTVTEPVHRDIYLSKIEQRFVDSPALQRLRRVKQLGTTSLVYPGATHSRFAHSLGTLRSAQDLLDAVLDQRNGPDPRPDLFSDWWSQEPADSDHGTFNLWVAEATVLARLGGLLHDICHIPFGHSIEDDLGILEAHDANDARFDAIWGELPDELRNDLPERLVSALRVLIVSKTRTKKGALEAKDIKTLGRYAFVADIVGNTICADLLDYLARDHLYTGLPAGFGTRFMDGFYVTPTTAKYNGGRVAIRIRRNATIRADVVTELFKFLRYRYELSERALNQHAKVAADAMIGKAFEIWFDAVREAELSALSASYVPTGDIDEDLRNAGELAPSVEEAAKRRVEDELRRRGDDGILEYLRDRADNQTEVPRMVAVGSLVSAVLDRRLYKKAAQSDVAFRPIAAQVFDKFGGPAARRRLERDCARYVGLEEKWHVLLWIPSPKMRMKAAEVLVDDGERIVPLNRASQGGRGDDIYRAHEALWAVTAYVHPDTTDEQTQIALAWLAREMGIGWADKTLQQPSAVLTRIALRSLPSELKVTRQEEETLQDRDLAASKGVGTFADLRDAARSAVLALRDGRKRPAKRSARRAPPKQDELPLA